MDDPGSNGPGRVIFVMAIAQSGSYTFTDPGPKKQKMIVVHVEAGDAIMFRGKYRLEWIHGGACLVSKYIYSQFIFLVWRPDISAPTELARDCYGTQSLISPP